MLKPLKILFICIFISGACFAQQDPQFGMSYANQMFFNPANIGYRNCIGASVQGRFQWVGVAGAPIAWNFGLDIPFFFGKTKQNCIGFGMIGYGDYVTYTTDGGLRFGVNYRRCNLGPGDLALGIDMGIATKRYNNAPWAGVPDPALPDPNAAGETFDMGVGVNYAGDNFYTGISCTHLNAGRISQAKYTYVRHLYVNGGGYIPLGAKQKWKLNPNGLIKTDFATLSFDLGLNALCFVKENHAIQFGTNYRFMDAIGLNIGYGFSFKRNQGDKSRTGMFVIAYNIDLTMSHLSTSGPTSHEILLRFFFPAKNVKLQRAFF